MLFRVNKSSRAPTRTDGRSMNSVDYLFHCVASAFASCKHMCPPQGEPERANRSRQAWQPTRPPKPTHTCILGELPFPPCKILDTLRHLTSQPPIRLWTGAAGDDCRAFGGHTGCTRERPGARSHASRRVSRSESATLAVHRAPASARLLAVVLPLGPLEPCDGRAETLMPSESDQPTERPRPRPHIGLVQFTSKSKNFSRFPVHIKFCSTCMKY